MAAAEPNIDFEEIKKFEDKSPGWWEREGEFKALHDINPLRVAYIADRVPLRGKRVLDIGCGGGILSESMAFLGANVVGIDAGEAPLAVARQHLQQSRLSIRYRQITAERLAREEPAGFDVVTCMELLEHVPDPASIVQACATLVKPGGGVFFATLNRTLKCYLLAIVAAEYILGIVKKGTHSYHKLIKPSEIDGWAREVGLIRENLSGLQYNPVLKRMRLGGSEAVNYLMHLKKPG